MVENIEIAENERMGNKPAYSVSVELTDLCLWHILLRLRNLLLS